MKTVKFSLNELMSEIDESFIEEVYFHDCNKILKKYSKQKIRQNVFCKTASKHKPLKFTYRTAIIVTVVSVFLCMPVYAAISHLLTSALIDDSNRHLIGTETNDRSYIILKDGVYTNEKGKVVDIEELAKSSSEFPESRIVKSSLMPNFIPSSIVEIPTDKSDEMYIIPEIILINNSLCVLTQDNGKGWELTDKDNIVISFDKYKSDITVSQDLIIGYVKDGIMYEGEVFDELSGKYSHGQQRHQGGHGNVQALRHDQHRDDIEDQLHPGQQVFLDALVQLRPSQQPPQQLAQQVDGHQADQQRGSGGEDRPEGELGQRVCEQGSEVRHTRRPLCIRIAKAYRKAAEKSTPPGRGSRTRFSLFHLQKGRFGSGAGLHAQMYTVSPPQWCAQRLPVPGRFRRYISASARPAAGRQSAGNLPLPGVT